MRGRERQSMITHAELLGYTAAIVTFVTYSMKTMIPLRVFGIAANVLFMLFGYYAEAYPTLFLHAVLLPLNSVRLYQMVQLVKRVRDAHAGDLDMEWLKPYMTPRNVRRGKIMFRKGDRAQDMFYVVSGEFRLVETGLAIMPGAIVGELGLLTPNQTRTQTLECVHSARLLEITYDKVLQLYFQNPQFGLYFLRLTTRRLFENIAKLEANVATHALPQTSG